MATVDDDAFAAARARLLDDLQAERALLAADQLEIDFRQQLGIEQRAVLGAMAVVDAVAAAKRVERVRPHRVLAARDRQRVDDAVRA